MTTKKVSREDLLNGLMGVQIQDGKRIMSDDLYQDALALASRPSYHKDSADVRRFTTQVMTGVLPRTASAFKSEVQRTPKSAIDKKGQPQINWPLVVSKYATLLAELDVMLESTIKGN